MSNSDLLDDSIIYDNLNTNFILDHSRRIANRVLVLSFVFFCFSIICSPLTVESFEKMGRGSHGLFYFAAALSTQLGTFFLALRLFLYQQSIRKRQDWLMIFGTKYKVWRALAIVFFVTLTLIALLVMNENGMIS